ncbi:MAG: DUF1501 domain-containing protein [Gemmataceae bacterium]
MLHLPGSTYRLCDGVNRREFLQLGGLGMAGLALPELYRGRAAAATRKQKARSCILLFLAGGPPQQDTFDLKPDAPAEVRGVFGGIDTSVPGIRISEQLPLLAKQAQRYSIIRSVTDEYAGGAHGPGVYLALTGHKNARVDRDDIPPAADDFPCMGSAISQLRPGNGNVPPFVWLLDMYRKTFAGEGGGFLGKQHDPFRILQDPSRPDFRVRALEGTKEVPTARMAQRRFLLEGLERQAEGLHRAGAIRHMDAHQQRAFNLLLSPQCREAFNLDAEPAPLRDRYGRHKFGQAALLARRLIEHEVPLVTVYWSGEEAVNQGWDLHYENKQKLPKLTPSLDQGFSALLEDLAQRGMLEDTLVVCMGEFGRAPRIEDKGGRGHWARVYSAVVAGGGVPGGQIHGKSDAHAAYPSENPVTPMDLVTSIYHNLGIPLDTELRDYLGRPLRLCQGDVIQGLF